MREKLGKVIRFVILLLLQLALFLYFSPIAK